MATPWFPGRGTQRGTRYIIKKRNIQNWVNKTGGLSMPSEERPRLRKSVKEVIFFDLVHKDKFTTDPQNFRDADEVDGLVFVPIERFNVVYHRGWE